MTSWTHQSFTRRCSEPGFMDMAARNWSRTNARDMLWLVLMYMILYCIICFDINEHKWDHLSAGRPTATRFRDAHLLYPSPWWGHRLPPQSSEVGTDYAASWTTMDTDIGMCSVVVSVLFNLFKVSVMTWNHVFTKQHIRVFIGAWDNYGKLMKGNRTIGQFWKTDGNKNK